MTGREVARRARKGQCSYCGRWGRATKDHVPPKAFFAADQPTDSITVLSCEPCRANTPEDDAYAASLIALREEAGAIPDSVERRRAFLRWLAKPEAAGFARSFLRTVRKVPGRTPAGLYATRGTYPVDLDRVSRVMERTIRGLWRHHHGSVLRPDASVTAFPQDGFGDLDREGLEAFASLVGPLRATDPIRIGDGRTFRYKFTTVPDDTEASVWILEFYENTRFLGLTIPLR